MHVGNSVHCSALCTHVVGAGVAQGHVVFVSLEIQMKEASKALVVAIRACLANDKKGVKLYDVVIEQLKADGIRRDASCGKFINNVCYVAAGVPMNEKGQPDRTHEEYSAAQNSSKRIKALYLGKSSAQAEDFDVPANVKAAALVLNKWASQFKNAAAARAAAIATTK